MLHSASVTALIANISLSGLDYCLSDRCVDLAWIDLLSLLIICLTVLVGLAVVAVLLSVCTTVLRSINILTRADASVMTT